MLRPIHPGHSPVSLGVGQEEAAAHCGLDGSDYTGRCVVTCEQQRVYGKDLIAVFSLKTCLF